MVEDAWSGADAELAEETSAAFGDQWVRLGEEAEVDDADLLLHVPSALDESIFSGLVLDAGCGIGRYTALAARRGATAVGMDVSEAAVEAGGLWPDAAFVRADLVQPPFAPGTFDLVYSFGVLHHLPDPQRGLQTCFSLVKPGGVLLVWVYSAHEGLLRRGRVVGRRVVRRRRALLTPLAWTGAVVIKVGLATGLLGGRRMSFYEGKGLKQIYIDCHDALMAPAEVYLSEANCCEWLTALAEAVDSGFERRRDGSGWILWARK